MGYIRVRRGLLRLSGRWIILEGGWGLVSSLVGQGVLEALMRVVAMREEEYTSEHGNNGPLSASTSQRDLDSTPMARK
jgi:hypothetical protein